MSFVTPNLGDTVLPSHISQFTRLLTGVSGGGQNVRLVYQTNASDYANIFGNVDTTNGYIAKFQYGDPGAPTTVGAFDKNGIQMTAVGSTFARLAAGVTPAPTGNLLLVSETTTATTGQSLAVERNNTAGSAGDVSGLRVVVRDMTTANNQSRPSEFHMIRTSGSGNQPTSALELTIQGNVAESVAGFYHNAIRIMSLPTTWSISGGVRQGNAIFIGQDESGFENGILYNGTAAESNVTLFKVTKTGAVTCGDIVSRTTDTYNNGSAANRWLTVYSNFLIAENGAANAPSITFRNSTTAGFYRSAANAIGITTASTQRGLWDASGNFVVGTAALATNATDGFFYIPTCAGAPSGTPTAYTGRIPLIYDSTNNKLYGYNGAWKSVTLA